VSRLESSFRDPSGHVFVHEGVLYRQINECYREDFETLVGSGLFEALRKEGLIVDHREVALRPADAYKVIQPERLPVITYPYEWCFSQLKDAALATLRVQELALEHGMLLKDASAYNVQFHEGRPVFIDTLSFTRYKEGHPWPAYRQFCQHFLAPLALIARVDHRLGRMAQLHPDGVPLDLASELLPTATRLSPGHLLHIHLHAKAQAKYSASTNAKAKSTVSVSKTGLQGLMASLRKAVENLSWRLPATEWGDYYDDTNYTDAAFTAKRELLASFIAQVAPRPRLSVDLGANKGVFSRVLAETSPAVVAADVDAVAVEKHYLTLKKAGNKRILPLILDLTAPSAAIGWNNRERTSFFDRMACDLTTALALIHHLAISNNVPLEMVATTFARLSPWLIIEFVPKSDSQVKRLLASREDVFPDYHKAGFEAAFGGCYDIVQSTGIPGTDRTLYLMKRRSP
jgi:hypothetical protein